MKIDDLVISIVLSFVVWAFFRYFEDFATINQKLDRIIQEGVTRSNPRIVHSDKEFYSLPQGTHWRDEAGNEGQR